MTIDVAMLRLRARPGRATANTGAANPTAERTRNGSAYGGWGKAGSGGGPPAERPRSERALSRLFDGQGWLALRVGCDLAMLTAGCVVGLALTRAGAGDWLIVGFPPLALLLLHARGRYVLGKHEHVLDSVAPGIGAVSVSAMTILAAQLLVTADREGIGLLMVSTWVGSMAGVTLAGLALPMVQRALRRRRLVATPTLIVGTDATARAIATRLDGRPEYGLRPVGFLCSRGALRVDDVAPTILGTLDDLEEIVAAHAVEAVIISCPDASEAEMLRFILRCDRLGCQTNVVPPFGSGVNYQRFEYLGTLPLLNRRPVNTASWRFSVKHAIDRVVALLLLVALLPLMAILATAIRLSSPGPVLFRQPRVGRDSRVFSLLKFRTMVDAQNDHPRHECAPGVAPGGVEGVDRRTRIGRFLRRTSLDELPQLFNVVLGQMSIVGPRPERPEFVKLFQHEVDRYEDRHRVRSGITGWAQVHGLRGQTPLVDRVEFDNFYIEHWSLSLDLKIMLLTIPALLRGS